MEVLLRIPRCLCGFINPPDTALHVKESPRLPAPQRSPEVGAGREEGAVAGTSLWEVLVLWAVLRQEGRGNGRLWRDKRNQVLVLFHKYASKGTYRRIQQSSWTQDTYFTVAATQELFLH